MRVFAMSVLLVAVGFIAGSAAARPTAQEHTSVWAVDLVRTLPGKQAEYLGSIEANWTSARALAVRRGAVVSYRALSAAPDEARGWDVLLMTEYVDEAAMAAREEIFAAIFAAPEYAAVPTKTPSAELRVVTPTVEMRTLTESAAR